MLVKFLFFDIVEMVEYYILNNLINKIIINMKIKILKNLLT